MLQAAKRVASSSGKRPSPSVFSPKSKRIKSSSFDDTSEFSPAAFEASLALPSPPPSFSEISLTSVSLLSNRAPLHLAFAVQALKYTYPKQPLSSRLSLAQAVVSANAKSKARAIGIQPKRGHQGGHEEEISAGQPRVRIMGREVPVMRRWGYDPTERAITNEKEQIKAEELEDNKQPALDTQLTSKGDLENVPYPDLSSTVSETADEPPLWGLDLTSPSPTRLTKIGNSPGLPIHQPGAARAYLLKSFDRIREDSSSTPKKKVTFKKAAEQKEGNLALLLHALDLLFESWATVLDKEELDRRAWSWYVAVRPEVKQGEAGWGQKGEVKISALLDLKRKV